MTSKHLQQADTGLHERVAKLREEVPVLRRQIEQLDDAKLSKAEALRRVDEFLQSLRERHDLPAYSFTEPGSTFPRLVQCESFANSRETADAVESLLAWLFPTVLREVLAARIEEAYVDGDGIDATQRQAKLASARKKLLDLEIEEERLILRAEEAGLTIHRRHDADPRALLEA